MKIDFIKYVKTGPKIQGIMVRFSKQEYLKALTMAIRFADGNLADWIRYSSSNLLPPPNHIKYNSVPDHINDEFNKDTGLWQIKPEDLEYLERKAQKLNEAEEQWNKKTK